MILVLFWIAVVLMLVYYSLKIAFFFVDRHRAKHPKPKMDPDSTIEVPVEEVGKAE